MISISLLTSDFVFFSPEAKETIAAAFGDILSGLRDMYEPGTIIESEKKYFTILCGKGALRIKSLQPEGKGRMDAAAYQNGNRMIVGEKCSKTRDM